jgi:O-antigen/teichoic acid export membrane protein
MNVERQAVAALKWTGIAKLCGQLVTWTVTLILLRLLAPGDYGLMALVSVVVSFLATLSEMGLGSSVVQAQQLSKEELARVNGLVVVLNVAACVVLVACSPIIAHVFQEQRLAELVRVASLQFLLSALATMPQSLAYRRMGFRWLALVDVVSSVAGGLCALAFAWYGAGVWALVLGSLAQSSVRTAVLLRDGWVRPVFASEGMRRHLTFGGAVMAGRVLWIIVYQSDLLIAGRLLPNAAVGLYSVSLHVATLPMGKIMGIVNQVALPAVARLQTELPRLREGLLTASRLLTFASVGSLWGLSSVAPEFVGVVLGSRWEAAVYPVQVICLIVPMRMLNGIFSTATLGLGRAGLDLRNSVTNAVVLPSAFYIGAQWGADGLATSWVVAIPIVSCVIFPRLARAVGVTLREVLASLWAPVLAGAIMYASVTMARIATSDLAEAVRLPLLIVLGAGIYLGVALSVDRRLRPEIRRLAGALRG